MDLTQTSPIQQNQTEIEKHILDICIKICKRGEGGMFILGNELKEYSFLVNQDFKKFSIIDNPKTIESLALQDGAVWINLAGELQGYGIMMTSLSPMINKGTRHASAMAASKQTGNKVFLISQEDKKIKIFLEGEVIMQIDSLEEGIEAKTNDAVNLLSSVGVGTLGTFATALAIPTLGLTLIPGILIFGGTHFIANKLLKK